MKAWRLEGLGGALRLLDIPKPEPKPGGVVVRVEASTLMSYLKAYVEGRLPAYRAPDGAFTPGGNGVGTVEAVGSGVWSLKPGQRVVLSSLFTSAEPTPNPAQFLIGITAFDEASRRAQAEWPDGTLAEYACLPASSVTPIDPALDHVPATQLATASRFAIPYGGLVRGRLAAGETLIVTGATGAYGSAAVLLAVAMGAGRVVAAGRNRERLERLATVAGSAVVAVPLTGERDADAARLRQAADGGAEMAFDMVGGARDPNATLAALGALRRNGRLVLMGSMSVDLPLPYMQLMLNGLEIIGNFMHGPSAYATVLALVKAGRLDLAAIAPRTYPLASLPEAMDTAASAGNLEAVVIAP
jgi:alcohol dehydrogenase